MCGMNPAAIEHGSSRICGDCYRANVLPAEVRNARTAAKRLGWVAREETVNGMTYRIYTAATSVGPCEIRGPKDCRFWTILVAGREFRAHNLNAAKRTVARILG
jgi:hypothetical protein